MKFKKISVLGASILAAFTLAACGTVEQNQQTADQAFGTAKMTLVVATGVVGIYNTLKECGTANAMSPPLCYNEQIADILNLGLAASADAIESAEKVFAAANTDQDARMKAVQTAMAVITEVTKNLQKYGLSQIRG